MLNKRKTLYLTLAVPLLAGTMSSPLTASADSRSEGFFIQDDADWREYRKTFESKSASSTPQRSTLSANASRQDVQKYVKEMLNSNKGVGEDIKIKGRKTESDGSYSVAIIYMGPDKRQKNLVVKMGKDGSVYDANTAMSDQELQKAYDEIVYGGKNEMSVYDVIAVNDVLHSNTKEFFQNVANRMGVSADTASKAVAEGLALAGVVIMGAGANPKQRTEIFNAATEAAHTKRVRAAGDFTGSLSGQTGNADYDKWIGEAAEQENVPANLLYCLLKHESNFDASAVSSKGAIGIAQFLPDTAASIGVNPYDPESSIKGAAKYLRMNFDEFGSWELALAGYNAGGGNVRDYGGIPPFPETQKYVSSIMSDYKAMTEEAKKKGRSVVRSDTGIFNDCSDAGVSSLTKPTQNFLNTLSTNFYNKTGIVLNVTSTVRPPNPSSYHPDGIAFDIANDEFLYGNGTYTDMEIRSIYREMILAQGGTPWDEYPGGEGEADGHGYNYHCTVHNQSQWR